MEVPTQRPVILIQANGDFVVRPPTTLARTGDILHILNVTPYRATVLIPPNGMLGAEGDIREIPARESYMWELMGGPGAYPYAIEVIEDDTRGFAPRRFARGESAPHVIIE